MRPAARLPPTTRAAAWLCGCLRGGVALRAAGPGGVPDGQSKRCLQSLQPHAQVGSEEAGKGSRAWGLGAHRKRVHSSRPSCTSSKTSNVRRVERLRPSYRWKGRLTRRQGMATGKRGGAHGVAVSVLADDPRIHKPLRLRLHTQHPRSAMAPKKHAGWRRWGEVGEGGERAHHVDVVAELAVFGEVDERGEQRGA